MHGRMKGRGLTVALLAMAGSAAFAGTALAAPPPNDDFADAEEITDTSATVSGTNVEATTEPDEPAHDGNGPHTSVWYRWTPATDGEVAIDTCTTDFDTILAVYTGSTLASLDETAANDTGDDCFSPGSQVDFNVEGGTTYRIAVAGWEGATGTFDLDLEADLIGPPGPPETFYVRQGGTGTDCTEGDPCETIAEALAAHRVTSGPGDVIDIGPGTWAENVDAGTVGDDGLTIRGTLSGSTHQTSITGENDGIECPELLCVAHVGARDVDVVLRDIELNNESTGGFPNPTPILLGGSSRLDDVLATAPSGSFTTEIVAQADRQSGKVIENSVLDGRDSGTMALYGEGGETTIRDSQLLGGSKAIQNYGCGCSSETYRIVRSWIDNTDPSAPTIDIGISLSLDSSLVTGGSPGMGFQGGGPITWSLVNTTIDAGVSGVEDTGETAIFMANQNSDDPLELEVDSSIMVEPIEAYYDPDFIYLGVGSVTCTFSDIRTNPIASEWTDDCQPGSNSNVTSDPATLFTGGSPFSWALAPGSAAIDTGNPAALGAGVSATDFDGNPRVAPGTTATCPNGVRDKGAYEAAAVTCPDPPPPPPPPPADERTLTVSTSGAGAGTVTGGGIDCGDGHTECTRTVPAGTEITLTATIGADSEFAGFTGGGCSESPCTVTMDADQAVDAVFAAAGEPETWFVHRPRRPWHRKPIFTMRTWPSDAPLECRVDDEPFEPCEAKVKLVGLEPGRHVFRARSFAFGEYDPSPARKRFRIPR